MEERLNNIRTDTTGQFNNRIKPKIIELLNWINRQEDLKHIIKIVPKNKKRTSQKDKEKLPIKMLAVPSYTDLEITKN